MLRDQGTMDIHGAKRSRLRWIFLGPNGLCAGWSIALFLVILVALVAIISAIAQLLHLTAGKVQLIRPRPLLVSEAVLFAIALATTWIMARTERRSVWSYGLVARRPASHVAGGWIGGLLCLSSLIGAMDAGGFIVFDGMAMHGLPILGYGLLWFVAFLVVGLAEEFIFRGYLLTTLTRGIGFWPASLVLSLLFAAAHLANSGESRLGLSGVVAAGLLFCLLIRITGSLWLGIGFHGAWDWAETFLYGTPDSGLLAEHHFLISHAAGAVKLSGGSAGPEGSILAAPAMALGLLLIAAACRAGGMVTDRTRESVV
jgi:membrane protease YdiL (CAAX protease family)